MAPQSLIVSAIFSFSARIQSTNELGKQFLFARPLLSGYQYDNVGKYIILKSASYSETMRDFLGTEIGHSVLKNEGFS